MMAAPESGSMPSGAWTLEAALAKAEKLGNVELTQTTTGYTASITLEGVSPAYVVVRREALSALAALFDAIGAAERTLHALR